MGLLALIRGFKISFSDFDRFLDANGLPTLEGYSPSPPEAEHMAKLFRAQGVDCKVRVFIPYATGYDRPHHLFVCCNWIPVLVTKEIKDLFPEPVPPMFELLRDSIGAKSSISRYVVYDEEAGTPTPKEINKRNTPPIACGVCNAVFNERGDRMRHRLYEHEIKEEYNPLPDC